MLSFTEHTQKTLNEHFFKDHKVKLILIIHSFMLNKVCWNTNNYYHTILHLAHINTPFLLHFKIVI